MSASTADVRWFSQDAVCDLQFSLPDTEEDAERSVEGIANAKFVSVVLFENRLVLMVEIERCRESTERSKVEKSFDFACRLWFSNKNEGERWGGYGLGFIYVREGSAREATPRSPWEQQRVSPGPVEGETVPIVKGQSSSDWRGGVCE
jgi:hypothetical protein